MLKMLSPFCAALLLSVLPVKTVMACSCAKNQTERSLFDEAEYVAHVKITAAELRDIHELGNVASDDDMLNETPEYVRVSFEEVEIFKKTKFSPIYLRELPFANGNCMLGLLPGLEYVIFLGKDSMWFVARCSGSGFFDAAVSEEVPPKIKRLREWAKERR